MKNETKNSAVLDTKKPSKNSIAMQKIEKCIVLYCIVLYCIVLYCIVLYFVLYRIVLYTLYYILYYMHYIIYYIIKITQSFCVHIIILLIP